MKQKTLLKLDNLVLVILKNYNEFESIKIIKVLIKNNIIYINTIY